MLRYYHYRKLSKMSRKVYMDIVAGLKEFRRDVSIDKVNDFRDIINAVKNDNPHFFYVDWYNVAVSVTNYSAKMTVHFKYTMTKKDAVAVYNRLKLVAPSLRGKDDYQTIKNVHDYIAKSTKYDHAVVDVNGYRQNDHNIMGPLREGLAVCEGIARTVQFLLRELRVECTYKCGYVNEGTTRGYHAWNIVAIGGKKYKIDVTWDLADPYGRVSYDYFCTPA